MFTPSVLGRRSGLVLVLVLLLLVLLASVPSGARAAILPPFGVDLATAPTPTLDTANGAVTPDGKPGPKPAVTPNPHDGADAVFYNTGLAHGHTVAPEGGQVLKILVKGCAVEDTSAPTQSSVGGDGQPHPVNTVNFETLAPQSDGSFKADGFSANHLLPFCANTADTSATATPDTVTAFEPVHLCITAGESVDFYDIGGSVPGHYPQGVPFQVLAPVRGSTMQSFVFPAQQQFGSGYQTADPNPPTGGFAQESNQEVLLQVVMGTGDDAYGLCPGGHADEPSSSSNAIHCVYDKNPEANAPAPPCPGYGSGSGGASGSGGNAGAGGGSRTGSGSASGGNPGTSGTVGGRPAPGRPLVAHQALHNVGRNRAVLTFVLTAARNGPGFVRCSIGLPPGMSFARVRRVLLGGIRITSHGRALRSSAQVVRGQLQIAPFAAAAVLEVRVVWPAIQVAKSLASAAHRKLVKPVHVRVSVVDGQRVSSNYLLTFAVG